MAARKRGAPPARRTLAVPAAAAAAALLAAGCGGGGADGDVEIRFSWWGSDSRHEATQEVIDLFEERNPGITVTADYTDWDGYWDKLATSTAADDMPDVVTMEERYLREYSDRGALADLNGLEALDTSNVDELVASSGDVEGEKFGVATGVNVFSVMADPAQFEAAGVEVPDDETWTWEEYVETAAEITEASGGDIYGSQSMGYNENSFRIYARQHGESFYAEDGSLGFSKETLVEWFGLVAEMQEKEAQPTAAESVEIEAGGPDQSVLSTGSGAMAHFWSNQLAAISGAAKGDVELLRYPGESEFERTGMYFKPAMYYSVSAGTEHPEEAAKFVDFLLNDVDAGRIILADRGLPANTEVRSAIVEDLDEAGTRSADFVEELRPDIVDGPPPPPIGAGDVVEITKRVTDDVQFGEITPEEAADRFIEEVEAATQQ
ncbi:ABC transporter substrate-binding protein [Nocardiopsis suaedae]|uniref:Extracellular solute-binding protein n=1 Tax=Nocardiopsis suaedae TaxID=3018444 RepID=A0ABT4TQV5_9ACTN|nr:extracellular solute-binding protein [Nocardiopsis suaedae]MDA2807052.1 extracellular solute-binding protein [Nocardiopsis suaedae]